MAALTDATLLWALNAVDLCDKCDINSFVQGIRVLAAVQASVCVRWPAEARKPRADFSPLMDAWRGPKLCARSAFNKI